MDSPFLYDEDLMNETERIRLYLRDPADNPRFTDEEINQLYIEQGSVEGATALGWLLIASELMDASTSESIGNTSETKGQPTERYKVAMAMHQYWKSSIPAGGARWFSMVPDWDNGAGGIVAELMLKNEWLSEQWSSLDDDPLRFLAF